MARIGAKHKPRLRAMPEIEGAFVRPLRVGQLEDLEGMAAKPVREQVLWLGENIVVDENGAPFEDLTDPAEIAELDSELVMTLIGGVVNLYAAAAREDAEKKASSEPSGHG